jgi:arginase family enzyme
VLVGARNLDPGEEEFIAASGLRTGPESLDAVLADADAAYVALDADSLDEREVASFMPEPRGLRVEEVEGLFERVAATVAVAGAGVSGLVPAAANVAPLERLCRALGL